MKEEILVAPGTGKKYEHEPMNIYIMEEILMASGRQTNKVEHKQISWDRISKGNK